MIMPTDPTMRERVAEALKCPRCHGGIGAWSCLLCEGDGRNPMPVDAILAIIHDAVEASMAEERARCVAACLRLEADHPPPRMRNVGSGGAVTWIRACIAAIRRTP